MVSQRKRLQFKTPDTLDTRECPFWQRFSYWIHGEAPTEAPHIKETPAMGAEADDEQSLESHRIAAALNHLNRQSKAKTIP